MKVVIATTTAFHLRHLALQLRRHGHEVRFHSYLPKWKTRSYGLPDSICVSHFMRLLPWSALALLRGRQHRPAARERLFRYIDRQIARRAEACDVFIGLSSVAVESARAARSQGAVALCECGLTHIEHQYDTAVGSEMKPPSAEYIRRELASYTQADQLVVLSNYARESFVRKGWDPARLLVMPLGVDVDRFTRAAEPAPLPVKAIFVGGWTLRKGVDLLGPLLAAIPSLTLTHVGSGSELPFPDSDRFKSMGHLDHAALSDELRRHHLFIFPTRDDGFGMVMAEALACGLRVVATTSSGGPELAEAVGDDWVRTIPPDCPEALRDAVEAQIAAIEAAPRHYMPPIEKIAALSWDHYGTRYSELLERLMAEKRA